MVGDIDVLTTMARASIVTSIEHGNRRHRSHHDGSHRGGRIIVDADNHATTACSLKLRAGNRDPSKKMAEICEIEGAGSDDRT